MAKLKTAFTYFFVCTYFNVSPYKWKTKDRKIKFGLKKKLEKYEMKKRKLYNFFSFWLFFSLSFYIFRIQFVLTLWFYNFTILFNSISRFFFILYTLKCIMLQVDFVLWCFCYCCFLAGAASIQTTFKFKCERK